MQKFYNRGTNGKGSAGADAGKRIKKMEILSETYYIISAGKEVIPQRLKGRTLIAYVPTADCIVIAGWGEDTGMIADIITEFLEISPDEYDRALEKIYGLGLSAEICRMFQTLEQIYWLKHIKE